MIPKLDFVIDFFTKIERKKNEDKERNYIKNIEDLNGYLDKLKKRLNEKRLDFKNLSKSEEKTEYLKLENIIENLRLENEHLNEMVIELRTKSFCFDENLKKLEILLVSIFYSSKLLKEEINIYFEHKRKEHNDRENLLKSRERKNEIETTYTEGLKNIYEKSIKELEDRYKKRNQELEDRYEKQNQELGDRYEKDEKELEDRYKKRNQELEDRKKELEKRYEEKDRRLENEYKLRNQELKKRYEEYGKELENIYRIYQGNKDIPEKNYYWKNLRFLLFFFFIILFILFFSINFFKIFQKK